MNRINNIIKLLIVISGTMQLAFSEKHIATITKVFYGGVGIYLFIFILLGAVCIFNIGSLSKDGKPKKLIVCCITTVVFGGIYALLLYNDVIKNSKLEFETVLFSFGLTITSIVMLGTGSILSLLKKY